MSVTQDVSEVVNMSPSLDSYMLLRLNVLLDLSVTEPCKMDGLKGLLDLCSWA